MYEWVGSCRPFFSFYSASVLRVVTSPIMCTTSGWYYLSAKSSGERPHFVQPSEGTAMMRYEGHREVLDA